jgi:hypothetical protein
MVTHTSTTLTDGAGHAFGPFLASLPAAQRRLVRSMLVNGAAEARMARQIAEQKGTAHAIKRHLDTAITLLLGAQAAISAPNMQGQNGSAIESG